MASRMPDPFLGVGKQQWAIKPLKKQQQQKESKQAPGLAVMSLREWELALWRKQVLGVPLASHLPHRGLENLLSSLPPAQGSTHTEQLLSKCHGTAEQTILHYNLRPQITATRMGTSVRNICRVWVLLNSHEGEMPSPQVEREWKVIVLPSEDWHCFCILTEKNYELTSTKKF